MKIAVNTRFLLKDKLEGIGWFTYETMKRIVEQHPEHEYIFLFDRPFDKSYIFSDKVKGYSVFPPARHPLLWYWWFERSIPKILAKEQPDVFLSPDGYCSLKTKVKTLLVMHDIAFEHYPNDVNKRVREYYRKYTPKFAHKAHRIATVSAFSKNDIASQYKISRDRIDVVYNGVNEEFHALTTEEQDQVRKDSTSGAPFFLFVGAIQPRKNISNLFRSFDRFKEKTGQPHKLVIAGREGWGTKTIFKTYENMQFKNDVVFAGRVDTKRLNELIGSATAMTFIPYFEGFGIPALEAQACNCPLITSDASSLPEVAGDGALLVDPFDISAIAQSLESVAVNSELRNQLISSGQENVKRFSWQKTSDLLYNSLLHAAV